MQQFGCQAYRFSLSWPRILPDGYGRINSAGLAYYDHLIDDLLANGIQPWVTLFHWDLPQALAERGGWRNRDTARRLGDFAVLVAEHFSDRVTNFFTVNEIYSFCRQGYEFGVHAPGMQLARRDVEKIVLNGCLAHGWAVQGLRSAARRKIKVGFAENFRPVIPVYATAENIAAARAAFRHLNGPITTLIREGEYPESWRREIGRDVPEISDEERNIITAQVDLQGCNIYDGVYAVADSSSSDGFRLIGVEPDHPFIRLNWLKITPEAAYWGPRFYHELWGDTPLYISESGCPGRDEINRQGTIEDTARLMFMRNVLTHLQHAAAEGIPVRGIFVWSFADNFE